MPHRTPRSTNGQEGQFPRTAASLGAFKPSYMDAAGLARQIQPLTAAASFAAQPLTAAASLAAFKPPYMDALELAHQIQPLTAAASFAAQPLTAAASLAAFKPPYMDAVGIARHIQPLTAAASFAALRPSYMDAAGLARQLNRGFDPAAMLRAVQVPSADLSRALGGAVDISALMNSLLRGADVTRALELGALKSKTCVPINGFDETVRAYTVETAERVEVTPVLPDAPIVYSPQRAGEPISDPGAIEQSRRFALDLNTALFARDELAYAIRCYAAAFLFLGLMQTSGAINDGPLPEWALHLVVTFTALESARVVLPNLEISRGCGLDRRNEWRKVLLAWDDTRC